MSKAFLALLLSLSTFYLEARVLEPTKEVAFDLVVPQLQLDHHIEDGSYLNIKTNLVYTILELEEVGDEKDKKKTEGFSKQAFHIEITLNGVSYLVGDPALKETSQKLYLKYCCLKLHLL